MITIFRDKDPSADVEIAVTWRSWAVWGGASLFYLYEFFLRVAPSVMEPELQQSFHLDAGALGGVLAAYYYIYAPMQIVVGACYDRFGARWLMILAALICAAGCFLEVVEGSVVSLAMARLLQGFGSAFGFVGTMYLATQWFPASRLALLSGLTNAFGVAGAILANAGIAGIVATMGWRITLQGAGVGGVLIAAVLFLAVPSGAPRSMIVEEGPVLPRPGILQSLALVYSNPQSWIIGFVSSVLYLPLSVFGAVWGIEFVIAQTGADKVTASILMSMLYVGWMVGAPLCGWISDRLRMRRAPLIYSCMLMFGLTAVLVAIPRFEVWELAVVILLLGLATSLQCISFVAAVEHNPPAVSGTAIAATNMLVMLAGGLLQALVGVLLDASSGRAADDSIGADAYRVALSVMPVCALLALGVSFFIKESATHLPVPVDKEPLA